MLMVCSQGYSSADGYHVYRGLNWTSWMQSPLSYLPSLWAALLKNAPSFLPFLSSFPLSPSFPLFFIPFLPHSLSHPVVASGYSWEHRGLYAMLGILTIWSHASRGTPILCSISRLLIFNVSEIHTTSHIPTRVSGLSLIPLTYKASALSWAGTVFYLGRKMLEIRSSFQAHIMC